MSDFVYTKMLYRYIDLELLDISPTEILLGVKCKEKNVFDTKQTHFRRRLLKIGLKPLTNLKKWVAEELIQ